ncbi:MAG: hypothetical protein MHMPM18_003152 [Marteilia pararefringens]
MDMGNGVGDPDDDVDDFFPLNNKDSDTAYKKSDLNIHELVEKTEDISDYSDYPTLPKKSVPLL